MDKNSVNNSLFDCRDLSWSVEGHLILDHLNFIIREGQFVGIIGPNGAGKSSLLRCLYRQNLLSKGSLLFNGVSINNYSRHQISQQISVVLQEPPLQFDLMVEDVIRMGLIPHKNLLSFGIGDDRCAIERAAKQVDLYEKLSQSFNSLSGGEKQRVLIARAIVQSPKLLLMDEPTNHLDIRHQIDVLHLAKSLGITVIVSLHDLNLAATFCDHLILLKQGKIIAQGTPAKVLDSSIIDTVFSTTTLIDQQPFGSSLNRKIRVNYNLNDKLLSEAFVSTKID